MDADPVAVHRGQRVAVQRGEGVGHPFASRRRILLQHREERAGDRLGGQVGRHLQGQAGQRRPLPGRGDRGVPGGGDGVLVENFGAGVEQFLGRQVLEQFQVFAERDTGLGGAIGAGVGQGQRQVAQGGGHGIGVAGFLAGSARAGQQVQARYVRVEHVDGQLRAEGVVAAAVTGGDQHPAAARAWQPGQRLRPGGVVEHQQPAAVGIGQKHQHIAGPLGRGAPRRRQGEGDGQLGQVGDPAVVGPHPRCDVELVVVRHHVGGCQLGLAHPAQPADRLGDHPCPPLAQRRVKLGQQVIAAGEVGDDPGQPEPQPLPAGCRRLLPPLVHDVECPVGGQHVSQLRVDGRPGDGQGAVGAGGVLAGHHHPADRPRAQVQHRRPAHPWLDRVRGQVQVSGWQGAMCAPVGESGRGQLHGAALLGIAEDLEAVLQRGPLRIDAHAGVAVEPADLEHGDVGIVTVQGRDRTTPISQHRGPARYPGLERRLAVAFPSHHQRAAVPDHVHAGQDLPRRHEEPGARHRAASDPHRAAPQEPLEPVSHLRSQALRGARTTPRSP